MKELEGYILATVSAKINEVNDQPRKRYADHRWVDHEKEEDHEYV
jgi:hypothetical protein